MLQGFPPIADPRAHSLILGSMPGVESLRLQQYYAYPHNAFWRIMQALYGIPVDGPYEQRTSALRERRLALWDVLKHCRREGSLDSNIRSDSIIANDFAAFFDQHPGIQRIFFNGGKAEQEYLRRVLPTLPAESKSISRLRLPSTSPANARLSFDDKLQHWAVLKDG